MPKVCAGDNNQPEVIPVIMGGKFGNESTVLPVIGMRNDFVFVGMPDNKIKIALNPCSIKVYCCQVVLSTS